MIEEKYANGEAAHGRAAGRHRSPEATYAAKLSLVTFFLERK